MSLFCDILQRRGAQHIAAVVAMTPFSSALAMMVAIQMDSEI
jgi:hypothetical protein